MEIFKKILSFVLVAVITAGVAISGTVAYLQSDDSDVNVMTMGNVYIEQHEYEREVNADGSYVTDTIDEQKSYVLKEFTQGKPIYPIVGDPSTGEAGWDTIPVRMSQVDSYGGMDVFAGKNAVDKFVTVENTGKSDAYIRTLVAIEIGSSDGSLIGTSYHTTWTKNEIGTITVDGNNYMVTEYIYNGGELSDGSWRHQNGILPAGDTSYPNLSQVYIKSVATNEDMTAIDGNGNGTLDILVLSQAVQVAGFDDAATALEAAFPIADVATWFGGIMDEYQTENGTYAPAPANAGAEYNGTTYSTIYEAVAAANASGGGTITLLGSATLDKAVEITSDITIEGNKAAYTRAEGYTGTMFTVKSGAAFTVEDFVIDGAGAAATGNLIATEANGSIILGEGAVLQNNNGAHAVFLYTRGGGSLAIHGGEIINNSSDSGAIWGGGTISLYGGKINNNSSTGSAGAIRMVSGCRFFMNGGEICGNTAAGSGGAIYGYGSSTYDFNGGKMSGNTAAVGGAMYTGDSSVINISGTFELTDNTADDAGALRLSNRTTFNMSGGKVSGNESKNSPSWDGFYGWNPAVNISGGELADDIYIQGGLTPTVGGGGITGVVHFDVSTNHNTVNLAKDFGTIKFTVAEGSNFAAFNFKPAADYVYTAGDEAKLVCMNEGYETYWTGTTFKIQAK